MKGGGQLFLFSQVSKFKTKSKEFKDKVTFHSNQLSYKKVPWHSRSCHKLPIIYKNDWYTYVYNKKEVSMGVLLIIKKNSSKCDANVHEQIQQTQPKRQNPSFPGQPEGNCLYWAPATILNCEMEFDDDFVLNVEGWDLGPSEVLLPGKICSYLNIMRWFFSIEREQTKKKKKKIFIM